MGATVLRRSVLFVGGAVVLVYLVPLVGSQHCLRALAWRFSIRATDQPVKYVDLLRARLGAEALGYLSFTGAIGSQTSKVLLLRKGIPARSGAATVAVDAAAAGIAGVLFVGGALLFCQWKLQLPAWTAAIGGALVGAASGAWLMAAIWSGQRRHDLEIPDLHHDPPTKRAAARDSMRLIRVGLVRLHGLPFALMIGIHILGHMALAGATWSIISMLGIGDSFSMGLLFEVGGKLGNTMGVVVPARLGVFEAGVAASANVMDLDPAAGIAVGLVRRLIDILWVSVGLTIVTLWPINLPKREGH
jgi:hypothetical protein